MQKLWRGWVGVCSTINRCFERLFMKWAGIVSKHPLKVIFIGLFLSLGLMAGFARFKSQNQSERLYFPENSQSAKDLDRAEKSFPLKAKSNEFMLTMADEISSVLNPKIVNFALKIHMQVFNTTGIESICLKASGDCLMLSILELFNYTTVQSSKQVEATLLNAYQNPKILMSNGRTLQNVLHDILGDFKIDLQSNTTQSSTFRMIYYEVFPETDDMLKRSGEVQDEMIKIFQQGQKEAERDGMKLLFLTGRSIDDAISESSGGDISLVSLSITLMCTFGTIVLIGLKDRVGGHVGLGFVGIGCVALGIGSGFGLVMLSGQYFVSFVGTLPFLVLGVGIDDMFIILGALDGISADVVGFERVKTTMAKVGASVTMTTLTDMVAFAISASSDFPAIRYFCFYALTTICFSYLLIMTVFLAAMSFDVKRIEGGRWDMISCKKTHNYVPWVKTQTSPSNKLMRKYAGILMTTPARISVIILSIGLLAAGIYGTTQLDEKFDVKQLAPDGSYFIAYQDKVRETFAVGHELYLINDDTNFDYTDHQNQQDYNDLVEICKGNPYLKDKTINWLSIFMNSTFFKNQTNNMTFYQKFGLFLQENPAFNSYVKFDAKRSKILYSRIQCEDKDVDDWIFRKNSMLQLRDDVKQKSKIPSVFPIAFNFFYREQIVAVQPETIKNLAMCAVAIVVITTPYLVHPLVIFSVFAGFAALVFELFGLMVIWGVALNSISMITSIMAIGFAVDYSAHIAHSFLLAQGSSPEERMIQALESIGASVFMGGFTTFLGILALVFGKSEIFRIFFKMIFGIVVLGLLNGLVFLPVYLSLFVRTKVRIRDDTPNNTIPKHQQHSLQYIDKNEKNVVENPNSPKIEAKEMEGTTA